jgi:hypothetical protein
MRRDRRFYRSRVFSESSQSVEEKRKSQRTRIVWWKQAWQSVHEGAVFKQPPCHTANVLAQFG